MSESSPLPSLPLPRDLARPGLSDDPQWFRHTVFYEVLLRAFGDSTGSGSGDIRGLTARLDYLQWLGVGCLWIPPFYPSPQRDGGYDVSDFTALAEQYGTLDDFAELLAEAHARGIRVMIDLVMNHTSDAHPWFEASRSNPAGPYGDFYVWADDDSSYADARIIFTDTETSNWTLDPVRGQYFWHRFFSHQPDLNYENPKVQAAMLDVVRTWARRGVDGFRLDAVPYLFESEGTNCENLPATHDFLADLRAMLDAEFPGTVLLAEANQWPDDVVPYYGTADRPECHMCFHFPVMPRIFYSLRDEKATALRNILAATPAIPPGTQWSIFLRNHDELTLEMVTDDERRNLYDWYAPAPRMRANVGIRRRLAPLLENSRAEIELSKALLLSLPGSPCLYYGDEIGMGDDIWLPDRDGVRTPMQWSPDPSAGFSTADPSNFYLPLNNNPHFSGQVVNVESQLSQRSSLLLWMRNMLTVRRRHTALGDGDFKLLTSSNDSVLAFTRSNASETLLCVMNFASTPQAARLQIADFGGAQPIDVFGGARFPKLTHKGSCTITLGARGFYWLLLQRPSRSKANRRRAREQERNR
ncbi:maltose alpha-D-glucosyltransferase [Actinobaculum sp. 352]|uniref:maltose alpha-D-glucosyltransferase n=1 Tax=Actinobaculum sp. 352 TaxID=2490946 RepID=UPI001F49D2FE|nr:maltose alpha-D-glucosyltransferase [Actinobaculum sp. 352]